MIFELCRREKENIFGMGCKCNVGNDVVSNNIQEPFACRIYCCELLVDMLVHGWTWIDDNTGRITTDKCG